MAVKLQTKTGDLLLIIAYGPHEGYQVSHYISFLTGLETLMSLSSRRSQVLLIGDFNAKIGRDSAQCRGYGLYYRESRNGRYLLQFCQKHDLIVANSLFPTGKRKSGSHKTYVNKTGNKFSELNLALVQRKAIINILKVKTSWNSAYDFHGQKI